MMRLPRSTEDEISKLGRNDPCHCGSEKKYKKCHLAEDAAARSAQLEAKAAEAAAAAEAAREAEEGEEGAEGTEKEATEKEASKGKAFGKGTGGRAGKPPRPAPTARKTRRRGVA